MNGKKKHVKTPPRKEQRGGSGMCCLPNADRVLARELPKELQRVLKLQIRSSELENMGHIGVSTQTSSQSIHYISSVLERSILLGTLGLEFWSTQIRP